MGSSLLAARRLAAYLLLTALLIPVQALAVALRLPLRDSLPRAYHRLCCRIVGIRARVHGTPTQAHPALYVSNHSSYLDIMVLGSLLRCSFVAKSEVAGWPLFGLLAKLQRTVFVDRNARGKAARDRDTMQSRLAAGDALVLFPEGTSSDGLRTLPFKTALFAVAGQRIDGVPLVVQPVSVAATELDGIPLGRAHKPYFAWYGDMDLAPHLWEFLRLGEITVDIVFHPPLTIEEAGSRKALADRAWQAVASGVALANAGRLEDDRPPSLAAPEPDEEDAEEAAA